MFEIGFREMERMVQGFRSVIDGLASKGNC